MLLSLLKSMRTAAPERRASGEFAAALSDCVAAKLHAFEEENIDYERWLGGEDEIRARESRLCRTALNDLLAHPDEYARTYELFEDPTSRELYVQLVAYRLLGHAHVRLPTNRSEHWQARARVSALPTRATSFAGHFGPLLGYEIDFDGERVNVEAWPYNVTWTFFLRQYYFERDGVTIRPRKGDRVIDAGGFFGESALAFAASVGAEGKVASFEIDPMNLRVARRNLELNPTLAERIELRACALAADQTPLYLISAGPASIVTDRRTDHPLEVDTIDDCVRSGVLDRVDFIKMDIEGAERLALAGAEQTLRRCRPALAISIYHRPDDLWKLALDIHGLGLGYRFYLDHYTIHSEESVLYATADQ